MTIDKFLCFYPQFKEIPMAVLEAIFDSALKLNQGRWLDRYREGVGLYAAHLCVQYLRNQADGAAKPFVTSKSVGGVSMTLSPNNCAAQNAARWGELAETAYGLQLISLAKMAGVPRPYIG